MCVSDPSDDDGIASLTLLGPRRALIDAGGPDRTERTSSTALPSLPHDGWALVVRPTIQVWNGNVGTVHVASTKGVLEYREAHLLRAPAMTTCYR